MLDDMSSVNTGVSKIGLSSIKTDIHLRLVNDAVAALEHRGDIEQTLKAAWNGVDCDKFIENFKNSTTEVCNTLKDYDTQITAKLDQIYTSWGNFQNTNVQ